MKIFYLVYTIVTFQPDSANPTTQSVFRIFASLANCEAARDIMNEKRGIFAECFVNPWQGTTF